MIVTNLKQIKINLYEVKFDNESCIKLYDETILKYNLTINKSINASEFENIKKYNDSMIIFFKLRNTLLKKMKTKREVSNILEKENVDKDEIIKKLETLNLINDQNYLNSFVNDKINLTLDGPEKIKRELLDKGVFKEDILNEYDYDFWQNRVNKIVDKKNRANHKISNKLFKEKMKVYLYALGYDQKYNINIYNNDFEILKKEFNKLLIKYERLGLDKTKIKYDLLKKGFSIEDIKKLENEF